MASVSDSIQDLFADKGNIRGTGVVVVQPKAAGDVGSTHHFESLTYVDKAGHIHAVLIDTVTTGAGPVGSGTTIEILADVVVTPPPG